MDAVNLSNGAGWISLKYTSINGSTPKAYPNY